MTVREKLLQAGVKNLREFGYPSCDEKSILTDMIYSRFFESMLKENRGHDKEIDDAIEELLKELTPHKAAEPKKAEPKKRKTRI